MALQQLGGADMPRLLQAMRLWARGEPLEQQAAAAALCEPRLLVCTDHARETLLILDLVTASCAQSAGRRSEDFKALRKGLAYCWSVAVVALPEEGRPLMERMDRRPGPGRALS
jgi:hypothetical protein